MAAPIVIEPGSYYEVLKLVAKTEEKLLGLFLTKEEAVNIYQIDFPDFHRVGVLAKILRILPMEQGGAQVVLNMEKRISLQEQIPDQPFLSAKVLLEEDVIPKKAEKELKAYTISIITTIKDLIKLNPLFKEELQVFLGHSDFTEPGRLADFSAALTTASRDELQELLDTFDVEKRAAKALVLLKKELDLTRLQSSINQTIESTISKTQREFFLREQLRAIRRELGMEKDGKTRDIEKFRERIDGRTVPEEVLQVIDEEIEKLGVLDVQSAEYGVCRNYLDWLTIIPWGTFSEECHDIKAARKILDEDHYGLKDIKERILEFISVGKLTGGVRGSIICLVGPPGVGKTSIGKSIARALGRKFFRFSVGGMRDEAEIKGHRRTYIGSMPGKMIQALKVGTMNPVIMIDEIDKIGMSYHGDPASALLEVLDPEQNSRFLDHYLDVPCDLSRVLFILTANVLDSMPDALQDRMEVLRLSGYIEEEKIAIAKQYLIPRNRKKSGLKASKLSFTTAGLARLIRNYAREAGVRSLENYLKKILRKVAKSVAEEEKSAEEKQIITEKNLVEYLGQPIFTSYRYYDPTPVGVCTGLAWTALGGAILYVESSRSPAEKTGMKLTGQAGDVMKESAEIAWSYLSSTSERYAPGIPYFLKEKVHIHIPEGATPKDGPSAGITMVTSLLSLLLNKAVVADIAMTGEITLTGKVLKIGGVKEKFIAAKRDRMTTLIFPKENERDYHELPDHVKQGKKGEKGIAVHFVSTYDEVVPIVFNQAKEKKDADSRKTKRTKANMAGAKRAFTDSSSRTA